MAEKPKIQSKNLYKLSTEQLVEIFKIPEPSPEEVQKELLRKHLLAKLRGKVYYDKNKELINQRIKDKKEKDPELFKQKTKEYTSRYYEKNKNEVICECGSKTTAINKPRHLYSRKHLKYVENQKNKTDVIEESVAI